MRREQLTSVPAYCVEGFELENAKGEPVSENVEGTDGKSTLKTTIAMVKTEIECQKGKSTGTIEDGAGGTVGKSTTATTFEECKLLKPANCGLRKDEKEIQTTELNGGLTLTAGRIQDKFAPRVSAFATVSIEGKENSLCDRRSRKTYNLTMLQARSCVKLIKTIPKRKQERHPQDHL